jgi:multidrug efflux system membrane fusion protein
MRRGSLILAILAVVVAVGWWKRDSLRPMLAGIVPGMASAPAGSNQPRQVAAVPVAVSRVERKTIPVTVDAIGTVQAIASIPIKPRIDSQIATVEVAEGARVKQGDLLFRLDDRALKAQLAQADAQVVRDRAQLDQARRDLARAEDLLAKRINSEVQRETAATALKVQEAQLAADLAQRENLAASVSYTEIRAPVSGRIGSISAKVGTTVRAADSQAIATVNQFDPIYVAFAVPQTVFNDLRAAMAAGTIRVDAKLGDRTVSGTVAFVENTVDAATGTIGAKAVLPNAEERLWPGSFVSVQATVGVRENAIAVPASAVQIGQQGSYLFVVIDRRKAELTRVSVAYTQGGVAVLASGLKGGEDVVVEGQLRLVDGAPVTIQPATTGEGIAQSASPPRS